MTSSLCWISKCSPDRGCVKMCYSVKLYCFFVEKQDPASNYIPYWHSQIWNHLHEKLNFLTAPVVHHKKSFSIFLSPAGMSFTKLSLGGNNLNMTSLFPPRESMQSDIPAGDGNIEKLFLRCTIGSGILVWYLDVNADVAESWGRPLPHEHAAGGGKENVWIHTCQLMARGWPLR